MKKKRVCVIGAGVSGLPAVKACLEEGNGEKLEVVCFERTSEIGGLWNYRPQRQAHEKIAATVMASTVVNTSKEMMAYSDFPPPPEFPNFMHHSLVKRYLELYVARFNLRRWIRFNMEVKNVSRDNELNCWLVELDSGKVEHFDAVMVCTGHHGTPNIPTICGMERFQGRVLHSHDYRDSHGFEEKHILVVGIGNSALDIAVELARVSKHVMLSTRHGSWIFNRVGHRGLPYDVVLHSRLYQRLMRLLPWSVANDFMEHRLQRDHDIYGLRPAHRFFQQHPAVNDSLANLLSCGLITLMDDIEEIYERSVRFRDGREFPVDVIVLCTGYKFDFPFLDNSDVFSAAVFDGESENNNQNELDLYKYVFPPTRPDLAFIGLIQPLGSVSPISEMQSRWAAGVFSGRLRHTIPTNLALIKADIESKRRRMRRQYFRSERHTVQVDFVPYMDELAELVGCLPNIKKFAIRDPIFAVRMFFGPNVPYLYRLEGYGAWTGAHQAIKTVGERVKMPLQSRQERVRNNQRRREKGVLDKYFEFVTLKCFALYLFVLFFTGWWALCDGIGITLVYFTFVTALAVVLTFAYLFHQDVCWL